MSNRLTPMEQAWMDSEAHKDTCSDCRAQAVSIAQALRPAAYREVAQWIRDSCEDRIELPSGMSVACTDCNVQARIIKYRADEIERGHG